MLFALPAGLRFARHRMRDTGSLCAGLTQEHSMKTVVAIALLGALRVTLLGAWILRARRAASPVSVARTRAWTT